MKSKISKNPRKNILSENKKQAILRLLEKKPKPISKKKPKKQLEEIVKAVKKIKKPEKQQKQEYKTNYNTPAEIYTSTSKVFYQGFNINLSNAVEYEEDQEEMQIKTQTPEKLTYQDIERITKQDIANSVLGSGKWSNISPNEREDFEKWKELAPGAKLIWWMLVQDSGFGVRDIVY